MLIVIPDDEPALMSSSAAFARLRTHEVRTYNTRPAGDDELVSRIQNAQVVINIRATTQFNDAVLARCPELKMISIWGTGTDNVDLNAARRRGIRVTNTPGVAAVAVAEHALALIMAVAKRTTLVDREVREGKWPRAMVPLLRGKTLGLIGTGAIGRELARLGKGIGLHVIAWSFHPKEELAECASFENVFRRSDVVSVHIRQSAETTRMIGREHFEMMKPTAFFINTARGAVVNEADLLDALKSGRIAGAGLDVFEREPLPAESPFFALSNVVLTPHAAGITPETTEAGLVLAIENVFAFLKGARQNDVV